MIRAFIAISPDAKAGRRLAAAMAGMADEPLLRRVPEENLHLTLAFLGDISPAQADSAANAVRRAGADLVPFGLRVDGELSKLDARGRVIAVAVKGDIDQLERMRHHLREALSDNGLPETERRFQPHLTVARVRPRASARERRAIWRAAESALEPVRLGFRVRSLGLYRSHIGPSGARYQLLAQSGLGGSGPNPERRLPRGHGRG